ncbi:hypothetical protein PR048_007708 [Dryococelus australis]|uniref:Uncharacterized protein n=1 Tax=Dryococelus australis TaxID=614101 RepID=A0ABQ9HV34_9NEOP|nr:hypothetical protein PR048_007708 [Dryococelus australis]
MAKTPTDRDILLEKPGRGKIKTNVYSTIEMEQLGIKYILFPHAFTGYLSSKVEEEGKKCLLRWYGLTAKKTSLNLYRYQAFVKSVANIKPDISSHPLIEGAARQHSYGTHHQVQQWLGNELSPGLWRWARTPSTSRSCAYGRPRRTR